MNQPLQWLTVCVFLSILGCGTNNPDLQEVIEKSRQVQAQTEKVLSDVKKSNAEIREKMEKGK